MKPPRKDGPIAQPKPARRLLRLFLRSAGYSGICLPPFGIYLLPERLSDPALIEHERCHWRQAERMGAARWAIAYLWYTLRYGYRDNPLEAEAREAGRRRSRDAV
jgi:hypothetical protein